MELEFLPEVKYWQPVIWAMKLTHQARKEGYILTDYAVQHLLKVTIPRTFFREFQDVTTIL